MRFVDKIVSWFLIIGFVLSLACCLFVPVDVHAEDEENYVGSTAWEDWLDYWHSSLNVAVSDITGGTIDADDLLKVKALQYAYASMLYQEYAQGISVDPETGVIDYTADIPGGTIYTGWYYRGGSPHSVCLFCYGENGDYARVSGSPFPCIIGDDFTLGLKYTIRDNVAYPGIICNSGSTVTYVPSSSSGQYTLTFSGIVGSGIFTSVNLSAATSISASPGADTIVTLDDATYYPYSYLYPNASRPLLGCVKDASNKPISGIRQSFVRGSVANNFPDFVTDLKTDMFDIYPAYIIDLIWTQPEIPDQPVEPIYPTGDYVTGIPKEWTIENPPLPTSPNVSLSPRDADFSVIDPSEAVAQNASAFDFWWWLTDCILSYTDMKNLVVLFVGLGAVSYILWRIGR